MKPTTVVAVSKRSWGRALPKLLVKVMSGEASDVLDLAYRRSE